MSCVENSLPCEHNSPQTMAMDTITAAENNSTILQALGYILRGAAQACEHGQYGAENHPG